MDVVVHRSHAFGFVRDAFLGLRPRLMDEGSSAVPVGKTV